MIEPLGWVTIGVLIIFLLDWLTVRFSWRKLEYFLKPVAMIAVILWTLTAAGWHFNGVLILLILAQTAGLAGDIFLLLSPRWFMSGLSAFLMGHLVYIGITGWQLMAAVRQFGVKPNFAWWMALAGGLWMAMLVLFYRLIAPKKPRLTMPLLLWTSVQIYGWILSGFVVISMLIVTVPARFSTPMLFLPIGAVLFFVSDSMLAYDRFKQKMPRIRVWIMVTYHLAQFSLAAGFLSVLRVIC